MTIVNIINDHHTWIKVADDNLYTDRLINTNGQHVRYACRTLVLESCYMNGKYRKGSKWFISEHELKGAMIEYRKQNKSFQERTKEAPTAITAKDVERIVLIATYGIVNLDLQEV